MSKYIIKKCLYCQKNFNSPIKEINRGNGKFCSISCSSKQHAENKRKDRILNCQCTTCKKMFYRCESKQKLSKHGYQFCSRKCKEKAQTINSIFSIPDIFPTHYQNGTCINYKQKAFNNLPNKCNRCGYHHVGILQVHHIDRNRKNNNINNLEILCPNCHYDEHYFAKDGVYWKII